MLKNSIEVSVIRIEGIKRQENLSCHVLVRGKLYDVMAPLTQNNNENRVLIPLNAIITFEINSLEKNGPSLLNVSFNSNLLTKLHMWLPLYPMATEIYELKEEVVGPRLFVKINTFREKVVVQNFEHSHEKIRATSSIEQLHLIYQKQLEMKQCEIDKLKAEIASLKQGLSSDQFFEISNSDIDPVEIALNNYLARNKIKGLFIKYKGSLYKFGSNFVEISIMNKKLACRIDIKWSNIEDFIADHCSGEIEVCFEGSSKKVASSYRKRPESLFSSPGAQRAKGNVENYEGSNEHKLHCNESFQKLLRPTISTTSKVKRLHRPPFKT